MRWRCGRCRAERGRCRSTWCHTLGCACEGTLQKPESSTLTSGAVRCTGSTRRPCQRLAKTAEYKGSANLPSLAPISTKKSGRPPLRLTKASALSSRSSNPVKEQCVSVCLRWEAPNTAGSVHQPQIPPGTLALSETESLQTVCRNSQPLTLNQAARVTGLLVQPYTLGYRPHLVSARPLSFHLISSHGPRRTHLARRMPKSAFQCIPAAWSHPGAKEHLPANPV